MDKKPYGCLTIPGLITGLLVVLVVVVVGQVRGGVLFSPGVLNAQAGTSLGGVTSHAEFSGRFSACHAFFWQKATMADRCVQCHTDVAAQLQDPSTLHGDQLKKNPGMSCRTCHPDHHGPNASLTDMSMADISHDAFGYSLTAHQRQTDGSPFLCSSCHVNGYSKFDQTVCTTCHQQIDLQYMQSHFQAYGENCLACHDGIDSYGHYFDHSKVAFQLTGKHASLDCGACHSGARSIDDLKATPQDCYSCHAKGDAHQGQFGTDCGICHTTTAWLPATFDHSRTKFPLTGAHVSLACTQCHLNNNFTNLSSGCASCHPDPSFHAGLFASMSCDQCHNTTAWSPASFNLSHPNSCGEVTCIDHERATCRDCHPSNLSTATCLKCHDSNNPGDGGGGGG